MYRRLGQVALDVLDCTCTHMYEAAVCVFGFLNTHRSSKDIQELCIGTEFFLQ